MSFGLGSSLVGSSDLPLNRLALICERCPRCNGEGFKSAALIAGEWVGGDVYLCRQCRGAGGIGYALFPTQAETLARRLVMRKPAPSVSG